MKYACDKCLRVIREVEMSDCLKVVVQGDTPGNDKKYMLCGDCKPRFWGAVGCDPDAEGHNGKS